MILVKQKELQPAKIGPLKTNEWIFLEETDKPYPILRKVLDGNNAVEEKRRRTFLLRKEIVPTTNWN